MKKKTVSSEKKSAAAIKLGGQPENDQDARDAGFASATAPQELQKKSEQDHDGSKHPPGKKVRA